MVRPRMRAGLAVALVAVALVAASCGSSEGGGDQKAASAGGGTPVPGGELVDLQNFSAGEQEHLDPAQAAVLQGAQIGQLLYDGLTEYDFSDRENPKVKPAVAQSYTSNEKSDVWTFTLRKDVTFSDGTPVRPSDFKAAWEAVLNPQVASQIAYILEFIKGAKDVEEDKTKDLAGVVADDNAGTLQVTLNEPFADFPGVVTHPVFSPKPKAELDKLSNPADWEKQVMIGNGPFKMTKPWAAGDQEIVLVRNDAYYGGIRNHKAYLDKITFKVSKDLDSAYTDFEAGNGDTGYIPSGKYSEATGKYPHATDPSLGLYYFGFNLEDPVVGGPANLKLRQAISLAVDRQGINKAVYDGSRRMPSGITPPGVPGFKAGLCGEFCPENPNVDRAKKLLDEWRAAGGKLNGPLKIQFNAGGGHEDVVNIMVANLKAVGLDATPDGRDAKTYFSAMRRGECQICRTGWLWDYPLYDNAVYALLDSASIGGDNFARLNDPALDKDITDARAEKDAEKRAELYRSAEKRGLDVMATMPINWYAGQILYKPTVQNVVYTPLQFLLYEEVWLKK